jgi:tRNA-2-methylthio-N6-dimethylallyladenosine synthase
MLIINVKLNYCYVLTEETGLDKNMEERKNIKVPAEDIARQHQFIEEIKEYNAGYETKEGKKKRFYLQSFGCQMNENDSERLAGMLSEMGYTENDKIEGSHLIIFNTCCVRENAELKVYGHLGALKKLKNDNPDLIIAICGCMMQQKEVVEHITSKYRHVDLIFGTHNLYKFPELLFNAVNSKETLVDVWEATGSIAEGMPIERKDRVKAWVTIMYGCNNFCSYCIVPYVRGKERSRNIDDIINEVTMLGCQGYKEITLLGQNVNSYGKDLEGNSSFAGLLKELNRVEGIERIRFMTSHPKDLSDELIYAMRDLDKVCLHLHLPVQAGSTRILQDMNRKYTKEDYIELARKVKENIPGIAITTDIIVGYPGETEEDFQETLDVLEKVRFDSAFTFLYSKRTGTPAAKSLEQVDEEVKKDRFDRLLKVQNTISKEINDKLLGQELEVLVEGLSRNSIRTYTGRTSTNKIVNFEGTSDMVGKLVKVKIENVQTWSLGGSVVGT